jgi:alpha-ketoglutaric semialdehyde dehydrogenase
VPHLLINILSAAMTHGGPFPATTDSRSTSVGSNAIKRFARPVTFQSAPQELLPEELKNENYLSVWRTIDGTLTKASLYL